MAFTTGTTMWNPNVLNIVDLQNTITSASGINLQNEVDNLSQMVNFTNKTISADSIGPFTTGGNISIFGSSATMINTGLSYDLYVYGNVYASNYNSLCPLKFTVGHEQPYEAMHILENGNVGISTNTPKARLHVNGPAIFDGSVQFNGDITVNGNIYIKGKIIQIE